MRMCARKRIPLDPFVGHSDESTVAQSMHDSDANPLRLKRFRGQPASCGAQEIKRVPPGRREGCPVGMSAVVGQLQDRAHLVRVAPSATGCRRKRGQECLADTGRVVLRRPPGQCDHFGWNERRFVENATNGVILSENL